MSLDLGRFPRTSLGTWPTPLEEAPRLSERLGRRVLLKRDDVNGLGGGGNKLRKLEFLLGRALADGVDTVITFGALQTNHGRQTAAACARLGLRCLLILVTSVPRTGEAYERSGNILLDELLGAEVHICPDKDAAAEAYFRLLQAEEAEGRRVATFPIGGSDALGSLGYVAAAEELIGQLRGAGVDTARIVVPLGSAGTAAGLIVGAGALGWPGVIEPVCVLQPAPAAEAELRTLAADAAALLEIAPPAFDRVDVHDRMLGPGYGVPTDQVWQALKLFARAEGVMLDPVYTGKAAAALLSLPPSDQSDEPIVFIHTGGLPGLFGYAPELRKELHS
ncbi:D-cysteine desulfhydrase family protein [Streptosporangium sp. NPDC000396]|uniref:D-cysteine desulfhydrase family protein n=1 Tax=Streptosporangium sp. NPDC000396 TaxID=3366185 RepID=UPI0036B7E0AB